MKERKRTVSIIGCENDAIQVRRDAATVDELPAGLRVHRVRLIADKFDAMAVGILDGEVACTVAAGAQFGWTESQSVDELTQRLEFARKECDVREAVAGARGELEE